jgi:uncharacterized membrane protein YqhA
MVTERSRDEFRPATEGEHAIGVRVVGWTRFIAVVPVVGLLVGSVALIISASFSAFRAIMDALTGPPDSKELLVAFVEIADIYLLGIVLYIIALGIFELFVDDRIPLPEWLEFHNLEDLKEKLIGVVVVVMGVFFLGRVIEAKDGLFILQIGVAIAAVVLALGYYVNSALKHPEK